MSDNVTAHLVLRDKSKFDEVTAIAVARGLRIVSIKPAESIIVSGRRQIIESLLSSPLSARTRRIGVGSATYFTDELETAARSQLTDPKIATLVSALVLPVRPQYYFVSAYPPRVPYRHLHVPQDLISILGVDYLHARGLTGRGVRVAMIDTGFYKNHPYYNTAFIHGGQRLNITTHGVLGTPASDPNSDEFGHGTTIASNVLAIAPECDFHHIKDDGDPLAAFTIARNLGAQVITCSWGWDEDFVRDAFADRDSDAEVYLRLLERTIQSTVGDGVIVIFASGNGPMPGSWPSALPEVICVGGALIEEDGDIVASDYATSFISQIYAGRRCPDVCGLVGPSPYGLLIMMPTQPQNRFDDNFSALDGTRQGDGWIVASGTSSAAPQVAGFAALLLQSQGPMAPQAIKAALQDMAVGVQRGRSANGHVATSDRPNLATGYGLVTLRPPNRVNNLGASP
jgi:subtilisin family serine protease